MASIELGAYSDERIQTFKKPESRVLRNFNYAFRITRNVIHYKLLFRFKNNKCLRGLNIKLYRFSQVFFCLVTANYDKM